MVLNESLMRKRQKDEQCHLLQFEPKKRAESKEDAVAWFFFFFFLERERESTFSLGFRLIGPPVVDGARSKVALRGEGYAWTPIWWSFDNSKR